jgi:hypothetical protein
LTEFTFQVAIRTLPAYAAAVLGFGSPIDIEKSGTPQSRYFRSPSNQRWSGTTAEGLRVAWTIA